MTNDCAICAENLTKRFGKGTNAITAVDHLTLSVPSGCIYGFLGPNGAGKSTTIKMLTGVLRPTEGKASIAGYDIHHAPLEVKRHIGVVPEGLNLYERLSANEYLELIGRLHDLSSADILGRREQLLAVLDLTDKADTLVVDFSHGMRKKLALAAALIHRPPVIFLDEPFEGVDAISARAIKDLLCLMVDRRGVTVFFSTHIMELVERLADQVAVINKGRLVAEGNLAELRARARLSGEASLEEVFLQLVNAQMGEGQLPWLVQ